MKNYDQLYFSYERIKRERMYLDLSSLKILLFERQVNELIVWTTWPILLI